MIFGKKKKDQVSSDIVQQYETQITELKEEILSLRQTVAAFPGAKQHYEAELKTVKEQHEVQIASMKQQLQDKENEVNIQVRTSLAAIGANDSFTPKQISTPSNTVSADNQKLKLFVSLTGNEQSEYYSKYQAEIDRASDKLAQQS